MTLKEVRDYLNKEYLIHGLDNHKSINGAQRILSNPLYAGYIEYLPWDIPFQKGMHDGIISIDTYNKIQKRLRDGCRPVIRKDTNKDFPLRNYLLCGRCFKPVTASWSKGRTNYYPYYTCNKEGCDCRYKTLSRDQIHAEYRELLTLIKPKPSIIKLSKAILLELWNQKLQNTNSTDQAVVVTSEKISKQIEQIMLRITQISNPVLIAKYEEQILKLEEEKEKVEAEMPEKLDSKIDFGTACERVLEYMKNPVQIWDSKILIGRRNITKIYFDSGIIYDLKEGFGTAQIAGPMGTLFDLTESNYQMVEMAGITLLTNTQLRWYL